MFELTRVGLEEEEESGQDALRASLEASIERERRTEMLNLKTPPWRTLDSRQRSYLLPETPQASPPLTRRHEQSTFEAPQSEAAARKQIELHRRALVPTVKAHVMSGGQKRALPRLPRPNRAPFLSISAIEAPGTTHGSLLEEPSEAGGKEEVEEEEKEEGDISELLRLESRLAKILQRRSDLSGRTPRGLAALLSPGPSYK